MSDSNTTTTTSATTVVAETYDDYESDNEIIDDGIVHLICSWAPLLSGELNECLSPDDETCVGGVAAVNAYVRHYRASWENEQPTLVLPYADRQSAFVQMHPLTWSINRLVFQHVMGWNAFIAPPSILTQDKRDYGTSNRDLSALQSKDFPLLLTNVAIPPSSSWFHYTLPVYFDTTTGLAVLYISHSTQPLNYKQTDSARGVLDYVARINSEAGCGDEGPTLYETLTKQINDTTASSENTICWIPIIIYDDLAENLELFLNATSDFENAPQLIIDIYDNAPSFAVPRRMYDGGPFLVSYYSTDDTYFHHSITLSADRKSIENVTLITNDLTTLNASLKDEQYAADITALRQLADQASQNNPVVGSSTFMPVSRVDEYRRCQGGECEIGNLFADSLLWWADADVGFVASGGLRGEGWPAGNVRISNIWESLPFPNNPCTGLINGVSLFKVFNHSINEATFEGQDSENGDRLLQVSGMRIIFNKRLDGRRIISMDIRDREKDEYLPIDRLKIYKFVTDSFICGAFDKYPVLLGHNLTSPGEKPSEIFDDFILQNIVADYLKQLNATYPAGLMGRLVNDTKATNPLNLVQTADSCPPETSWQAEISTCVKCPDNSNVSFLNELVEFEGLVGWNNNVTNSISLVNGELYNVSLVPKSKPSWLTFSHAKLEWGESSTQDVEVTVGEPTPLGFGHRMTLFMAVIPGALEAGTFQGTVSFGVLDGGNFPGCAGRDATFEVVMRVLPEQNLNQFGALRFVGFGLCGVVVLLALAFSAWVWYKRKLRIVKTLQPYFLLAISVGVLVMSTAIIPMSVDDEIATQRGCDIACMAVPWLLSLGFVIAMSALFSKLWRINRLFHSAMRRITVTEKDVIAPFVLMFGLNVTFLLVWTVMEPLRYVRVASSTDPWNSYGLCRSEPDGSNGKVSFSMAVLVVAVNLISLLLACFQVYKAREISDEFSESKSMGIALFSWFQLFVVGIPVLFLIDQENASARYFLQVLLIFAVSISMLLFIYVPMIIQAHRQKPENVLRRSSRPSSSAATYTASAVGTTRITGLDNFRLASFRKLSKRLTKFSFRDRVDDDVDDDTRNPLPQNMSSAELLQCAGDSGRQESLSDFSGHYRSQMKLHPSLRGAQIEAISEGNSEESMDDRELSSSSTRHVSYDPSLMEQGSAENAEANDSSLDATTLPSLIEKERHDAKGQSMICKSIMATGAEESNSSDVKTAEESEELEPHSQSTADSCQDKVET